MNDGLGQISPMSTGKPSGIAVARYLPVRCSLCLTAYSVKERLQMKALTGSSYLMLIHFVNCLYIGQKDEQLVFDCSLGLIVSCVNLL